jgi:Arylsulfotransferase (ASST)
MSLLTSQMIRAARAVGLAAAPTLLLLTLVAGSGVNAWAQEAQPDKPKAAPDKPKPKVGLLVNEPAACKGYTLIASTNSGNTYLVDMEGRVVNTWKSEVTQGLSAYLLETGGLLRTGAVKNPPFFGGGAGGRIQEFTWDGKLIWDYTYVNDKQLPNHDICKLPNGNVLMIVWEKNAAKDAVAAGRRPETVDNSFLLADSILEIKPTGLTTGEIVWEWRPFDHLIQDFDEKKANHGDVAAHPELIDINFGESTIAAMVAKPEELEKLRAIGYVGGAGKKAARPQTDWLHVNAVNYNAELDQVMLSVFEFSEIWVIDHSTKTAEAASHKGGKYGKGGDLLYRWGNPRAYRAGTVKDQRLFGQHNAQWIAKGLPGEGHLLVFNNGMRRTGGAYSTVDEIVLPVDDKGQYEYTKGKAYGPEKAIWSYVAPKKTDFYAPFISGAQRLANGNTLICSGTNGTLFEVTPKDEIVWKYINPTKGGSPFGGPPGGGPPGGGPLRGGPPFGGPPKLGQILPSFLQGMMNLNADQKKELETAEKEIAEKLGKMLTDEQKKKFADGPIGFGPGNMPAPGQLMATAAVERLKLSDEQKKQLAELQKDADGKLDGILKDDQKKQFKQMQDFAKGFGGPPGGGPPGGGPPGGGFPGFGAPGGGSGLFRAPRYAPDYPGLAKRELKATKTIEELEATPPKETKDK